MKNKTNKIIIFLGILIVLLSVYYGVIINPKIKPEINVLENKKINVYFENQEQNEILNFKTSPTTISFSIYLKTQDEYQYSLDVVNESDIDVKLNEIFKTTTSDDVLYNITWENGEEIKENDIIEKNSRKKINIYIKNNTLEEKNYDFTLNMNFVKI